MSKSQKNGSVLIWILLILGLGIAIWLVFNPAKKDTEIIQEPSTDSPEEISEGADLGVQNKERNYIPQYSENNPRKESVDPFTPHKDFETFFKSNQNRTDFDFNFGDTNNTTNYQLDEGSVDFQLKGTLKTAIAIEDNNSLAIEFYANDQISLTKRKPFQSADLPFIKETEKKSSTDKSLYSFDFEEKLKSIEPGLYYYLIIPTGRNRVLHGGKFIVR